MYKVSPEFVGSVFEKFVMPLTKEVEVEYLLNYVPILDPNDTSRVITPPYYQQQHSPPQAAPLGGVTSPLAQHPLVKQMHTTANV